MTSTPSNVSRPTSARGLDATVLETATVFRTRAGGRRRWTVLMLVAASVLGATACSEDSAAPTPTVELAPTSNPITTEASTTTTAPPSTEAPTTTEDPRIAEIEAAVAAARDLQVLVLTDPSIPVERLEEVVTGRALESMTTNTRMIRAEGRTVRGSFDRAPLETRVLDENHATHLECGLDALASYSLDRRGAGAGG